MKILDGGLIKCPHHPCVTVAATAEEYAKHASEIHGQNYNAAIAEVVSAIRGIRNGNGHDDVPERATTPTSAAVSNTGVTSTPPKPRVFTCGSCGKTGHRKRSCPNKHAKPSPPPAPLSIDDLLTKSKESSARATTLATALLAELRSKREALDETIARLEQLKDLL